MTGRDLLRTLALAGLMLGTACSSTGGPAQEADARPSEGAGGRPRTGLTEAERTLLGEAEQRLIADCMRRKGFQYRIDHGAPRAQMPERRFGLDDVAWARRHGYALTRPARSGDRDGKAAAENSPQARYVASLPPQRRAEFERELNGTDPAAIVVPVPGRGRIFTSADGCQADARARLYGDLRKWTEAKATVVNLEYLTFDEVVADPRYTRALATWRTCMTSRGLPYPSSSEAIGAVAKENRNRPAEEGWKREVTVAVADAECNRAAGLARTGTRLQRERVQDAAVNEFARQARYYTRAVTTALGRARPIAGSG
jgi:hypothetical protein